jgi:hypothetical protein
VAEEEEESTAPSPRGHDRDATGSQSQVAQPRPVVLRRRRASSVGIPIFKQPRHHRCHLILSVVARLATSERMTKKKTLSTSVSGRQRGYTFLPSPNCGCQCQAARTASHCCIDLSPGRAQADKPVPSKASRAVAVRKPQHNRT